MNEVVILTSSKDLNGIGVVDLRTGTPVTTNLKNNVSEGSTMCTIGGLSSFSGSSSMSSDYICISQAKKPKINIWQWGKGQLHFQCHTQEVVTSINTDRTSSYILGGTKSGNLYVWESSRGSLLTIISAHLKEITCIRTSSCHDLICTGSSDGTTKIWDLLSLVDHTQRKTIRKSHVAYRSWSPHTLPVKDMAITGNYSLLRVFTCALDRSLVLYDATKEIQLFRIGLPVPLECLTCNPSQDYCFVGGNNGIIYVIDLSIAAANLCHIQIHSKHARNHSQNSTNKTIKNKDNSGVSKSSSTDTKHNNDDTNTTKSNNPHILSFEGHTRTITRLAVSQDNCTLISVSEDGSMRLWDIWTGQCIKESKPLNKNPISNMKVILKPEQIDLNSGSYSKYHTAPLSTLQKYLITSSAPHTTATSTSTTTTTTTTHMKNDTNTYDDFTTTTTTPSTSTGHNSHSHGVDERWTIAPHIIPRSHSAIHNNIKSDAINTTISSSTTTTSNVDIKDNSSNNNNSSKKRLSHTNDFMSFTAMSSDDEEEEEEEGNNTITTTTANNNNDNDGDKDRIKKDDTKNTLKVKKQRLHEAMETVVKNHTNNKQKKRGKK